MSKDLSKIITDYALIDSGGGEKLEQFGTHVIRRPSGLCIWKKNQQPHAWNKAQATFVPGQGWSFSGSKFESWRVGILDLQIVLRLQSNGQVGLFPEHLYAFHELKRVINLCLATTKRCRVLNLFAFTGNATVLAASLGASVVHVDLSKKALSWAAENLTLNKVAQDRVRLVPDDALDFLKREERRNNQYDIIIVDPPSFSRISKTKTWQLQEILPGMLKSCSKALAREHGAIFLSCHAPEIGSDGIRNLLIDAIDWCASKIEAEELTIPEKNTARRLPAGFIGRAAYGFLLPEPGEK